MKRPTGGRGFKSHPVHVYLIWNYVLDENWVFLIVQSELLEYKKEKREETILLCMLLRTGSTACRLIISRVGTEVGVAATAAAAATASNSIARVGDGTTNSATIAQIA